MCDFGLADYCSGDKRLSEISGTPAYIAPEVIRQRYALPADIWSCGIVLYVLLSGRTPFHRKGDGKTPYKVVFKRILEQAVDFTSDPWPSISPAAKDLCAKLLEKDPKKRVTAAEALAHPWLAETGEKGDAALESSMVQRLQLFGSHPRLQQHAYLHIAQKLAGPEMAELQQLWDSLNIEHVAALDSVRMLDALELAGYTVGEREGSYLLKKLLLKGQEGLTFEVFSAAVLDWSEMRRNQERWGSVVQSAFDAFDADRDGFLNQADLELSLGELSAPDLKFIFEETDKNKDGIIDMAEFRASMEEKDRSVAMFDKRLSQRFRNSFPRRTNSYINRLQEAALDANGNQSGSSGSLLGTSPSPAADLAQAF